jgi:DNA-binding MarR family transcriptional regulator
MADAPTLPTYASGLLWAKAYRTLRVKVTSTLEKFHLTMTEWALLGKLYDSKSDGVHLAEVATALGVEPPLITTMVSQLEKKGLVGRKEDVRDRRAKFISLTDEGRELVPRIEDSMRSTLSGLFQGVTKDEVDTFMKVLQTFVKNSG